MKPSLMAKLLLFTLYSSSILYSSAHASDGGSPHDLMSQLMLDAGTASDSCDIDVEKITPQSPAIIFNDPTFLAEPFALSKTLAAIAQGDTATTNTPETRNAELLGTMIASHSLTSAVNPIPVFDLDLDPNMEIPLDVNMPMNVRIAEAAMVHQAAVEQWFPVGIFNRFDTAPQDGSHCGEYRIVYANPNPNPNPNSNPTLRGRFFTIFEAALPNPLPDEGIKGCLPVAQFWAELADGKKSTDLTDDEKRAVVAKLAQFYYQGIETDFFGQPVTIGPVVQFNHYQAPLGQVRTNEFMAFRRWQLREFRTAISGGKVVFNVETVKSNALTELFGSTSGSDKSPLSLLRMQFQTELLDTLFDELVVPDKQGSTANEIINLVKFSVPNRFNEFQSDSQINDDNVSNNTDADFTAKIASRLEDVNIALGRTGDAQITPQHILARIEASTCGGCHQPSDNDHPLRKLVVGSIIENGNRADINWPATLGFVHINEAGSISSALVDVFLPARATVLKNFVCAQEMQTQIELQDTQLLLTSGTGNKWADTQFVTHFEQAPVVFINANRRGSDSCHIRVRNITDTGFEAQCLEFRENGGHLAMNANYIALSRGVSNLGDKLVEAQCVDVATLQGARLTSGARGWTPVNFTATFDTPPVVLSQIISDNNNVLADDSTSPRIWLSSAVKDVTADGFMLSLDLSKSRAPGVQVQSEIICFAAIEQGDLQLQDPITNEVTQCEINTFMVKGWSNPCLFKNHEVDFSEQPLSVGGKMTRRGRDGGWLRKRCASNSDRISFVVDENAKRRKHIKELAGYLACERQVSQ